MHSKSLYTARALMDFDPELLEYTQESYQFLTFKAGEEISIEKEGQFSLNEVKKWCFGYVKSRSNQNNQKGWFPSNFVEVQEAESCYFELPWAEVCRRENRLIPSIPFTLYTELARKLALKQKIEDAKSQPSSSFSNDQQAPSCEGIFRRNAFIENSTYNQDKIDINAIGEWNVIAIAEIFKKFYSMKKQKFLTNANIQQIHSLNKNKDQIVQTLIFATLSPEKFINLIFLLYALHNFLAYADFTLMNSENLIMFFSSHIIESSNDDSSSYQGHSKSVLIDLIENYPQLEVAINKRIAPIEFDSKLTDLPKHYWNVLRGERKGFRVKNDICLSHEIQKCVNLQAGNVIDIKIVTHQWTLISFYGFHAWVPTSELTDIDKLDDEPLTQETN